MNWFRAMGVAVCLTPSILHAQVVAPPEVVRSAIDAVETLGKRVVLGDNVAAVELMYPKWKERMAKRHGGIEKLEESLRGIGEVMARNGVQIISFKTVGAPQVHDVWPGDPEKAKVKGEIHNTKWLLLIPTVTRFRILLPKVEGQPPRNQIIDSHGFQVAIADKGKNNWTFINGSDVTVSDLRSLFITLPANMKLPAVKREAVE